MADQHGMHLAIETDYLSLALEILDLFIFEQYENVQYEDLIPWLKHKTLRKISNNRNLTFVKNSSGTFKIHYLLRTRAFQS